MAKTKENKNRHEVNVKIEGEDWSKAIDTAFENKKNKVEVPGFRKGHVPKDVYYKKYGKESLFLDAADNVLPRAYDKALSDSKLEPVVRPEVELKNIGEDGVEFTFKIITKPVVNVKKYKGLNIKKDEVEVTDEEVEHSLGHLLEQYTELVPKDGPVANGDIAIIDFEGFKDGVAFSGGKGEDYSLEIGSNTFIPGFEEQLIGMKAGEEKDINVTFPEDYASKDLAGAKVVFKVKVNDVKEKKLPEYNEDFFDDLGIEGVDSEEKLKKHIKDAIKDQKEVEAENKYLDNLLEGISKNVEVDIPQEMVDEETDRLLDEYKRRLSSQGLSIDLYYQYTGTKEEDLKKELEKEAFNNVLYRLMLDELKTIEKVEVTDEETNKKVEELSKEYNMSKEQFLAQFGGTDAVKYDLEIRKLIDLLKDYNK